MKTKECMSYLKKVTTDAHNVLNNTLGQKHLFIYNNEYVFHKRQDTDCKLSGCSMFQVLILNFDDVKTMNMKLTDYL